MGAIVKQPAWKKFLSYFVELDIDEASSAVNPHLYVTLSKGRYQLCTDNAIYSYCDLYENFMQAFEQIDLDLQGVERVLILGFGLGSIPYMLEKSFHKNYEYTAVEIDKEVVNLANKYVVPELSSQIDLICTDARPFVMQSKEKYDLITMDIFLDDMIPDQFEQEDYLRKLAEMLTKDGILMYNQLTSKDSEKQHAQEFFENKFLKVFPEATYIEVKDNWILLNRKDYLKG